MNADFRLTKRFRAPVAAQTTRRLVGLSLCVLMSLAHAFDPLEAVPDLLASGVTLPGDTAPPPCPVTLDVSRPLVLLHAVDVALCNNPQIQGTWANIKIQAAALGEAKAAYWPTLSASASRMNDETRYPETTIAPTTIKRNTLNAALNWRLFDFGGRAANRQVAQDLLSAALASHDAALQKTLVALTQAYFEALSTHAYAIAKTENADIAAQTLDSARKRESKGAAAASDTLQAATAHARALLDKSRAEGSDRKARAALVYALGVPGGTQIVLPDDPETNQAERIEQLNHWLTLAKQTHPVIVAARAQLAAAISKIGAVRSEGLPTLDFSSNYYQNGRPGQSLTPSRMHESTLGVTLTVPVFEGFSRAYKIQGAEAQVEQKRAELADAEQQVLMEIDKVYADVTAAQNNLQAAEQLLTFAREAVNVSKRRYEKNAADILEMLNTQAALADAQQERIRSIAEWHSARLRLLANTGTMGRNAVKP